VLQLPTVDIKQTSFSLSKLFLYRWDYIFTGQDSPAIIKTRLQWIRDGESYYQYQYQYPPCPMYFTDASLLPSKVPYTWYEISALSLSHSLCSFVSYRVHTIFPLVSSSSPYSIHYLQTFPPSHFPSLPRKHLPIKEKLNRNVRRHLCAGGRFQYRNHWRCWGQRRCVTAEASYGLDADFDFCWGPWSVIFLS